MTAPIVTVRGEAELEVPPDLARLWFTLHGSGPDARTVWAQLAEGAEKLNPVLDQHESAIEDRATVGAHVGPVFHPRSKTKITGYRGSQDTRVVVHDFDVLSPLLLAIADFPNGQVGGPHWSLRRDNPAHREVRLAAIEDARIRATDYASAFGGRISELIEVSDLEIGGGGPQPMMAAGLARAGGPSAADDIELDLEPQRQRVYGRVNVRFALASVTI